MTDNISKTELQAMIDVQSRSTQQMEKIAASLATIVDEQKHISGLLAGCSVCKETIKSMSKDVMLLKWIWTSIAAIVGIGMVILQLIEHLH